MLDTVESQVRTASSMDQQSENLHGQCPSPFQKPYTSVNPSPFSAEAYAVT